MEHYIGADLGGTKLLLGELDAAGHILRTQAFPTGRLTQTQALARITEALDVFLPQTEPSHRIKAIGLGMVGRMNCKEGIWYEISPDRSEPLEVADFLQNRYHLPCFLDNDVRSATKAEMLFGKGLGLQDLIYVNVGTGIAAGFVTGGRTVTGGHWNAGEIGHTCSGLSLRIPCECGRDDCVESVASGLGLDRCARLLSPQHPGTALKIPTDGSRINAADIFRLSDTDPLCRLLTDNAAQALANLLMNLVRFNDPQAIVLGGGVVSDGFLLKKIKEKLQPHPMRFVTEGITLTKLDPRYIGLIGAASNAIIAMEESK